MINFFASFFRNIYELGFKAITWLFVYFTPIHGSLITVYILLICDLLTGLRKAQITGDTITAKKLRKSLDKFLYYSIILILAFLIDVNFFSVSALVVTHIVGYYIVMIEFKSNAENVSAITGTDLWLMIKDKVTRVFNK